VRDRYTRGAGSPEKQRIKKVTNPVQILSLENAPERVAQEQLGGRGLGESGGKIKPHSPVKMGRLVKKRES